MEKEQWINQVLNSTQNKQKVAPSPFLFARIEAKMQRQIPKIVSYKWTIGIAVSFALLVSLNVSALNRQKQTNAQTNNSLILPQIGFADDNDLYQ